MSASSMNDLIRRAAGRGDLTRSETAPPVRVGSIGIGVGGGSAPHRARARTSEQLNERLRASIRLARHFTVPGGVGLDDVNLDDLGR